MSIPLNILEKDKFANKIVDKLFKKSSFKNECIKYINLIIDDGVLNIADIPHIFNLVTLIYKKHSEITIKNSDIAPVLKLFIYKLFKETKVLEKVPEYQKNLIENLIDCCLDLLTVTLNSSFIKKMCTQCYTVTDDKIDSLLNKFKNLKKNIPTQEKKNSSISYDLVTSDERTVNNKINLDDLEDKSLTRTNSDKILLTPKIEDPENEKKKSENKNSVSENEKKESENKKSVSENEKKDSENEKKN